MTDLEIKLREILITAYENGLLEEPARSFIENHLVAQIKQAAREHAQTEKAYGGCRICYGKGYATVNGRWSGYDTDQDIGSPGGYVSGGKPIEMKYCTCDRGKQLSGLVKTMLIEARMPYTPKVVAKSELLALLEQAAPKKGLAYDEGNKAYNQAIDDYLANIREALK